MQVIYGARVQTLRRKCRGDRMQKQWSDRRATALASPLRCTACFRINTNARQLDSSVLGQQCFHTMHLGCRFRQQCHTDVAIASATFVLGIPTIGAATKTRRLFLVVRTGLESSASSVLDRSFTDCEPPPQKTPPTMILMILLYVLSHHREKPLTTVVIVWVPFRFRAGDPHFYTVADNTYFSFQGTGLYWLYRDVLPFYNGSGMSVQASLTRFPQYLLRSFITAIAIQAIGSCGIVVIQPRVLIRLRCCSLMYSTRVSSYHSPVTL